MTEVRTAIPDSIDRYLESLVRTGPFASKAELVRAALMAYATTAGPLAQGFDKETIVAPDGRIHQLEYAREASMRGGPVVGVTYENGVVLAAPKPEGKLVRSTKIHRVGRKVALAASGIAADGHMAVRLVRKAEPKTTKDLVDPLVDFFWSATLDRAKRPLAAAMLVASALENTPRLFYVDPSAALVEYGAMAIGEGSAERVELLEGRFRPGRAKAAEALALEALGKPKACEIAHVPR